jgi:uncharacterized membrane protein YhaH (DUF805 family)
MGGISIWHWFIVIVYVCLTVVFFIALVKILNRTGYSGWWSLLVLIPVVNVIALWQFSKARWPATEPPVKVA